MPWNLKRYHGAGDLHFITCSCNRRQPLLGTPRRRNLFLTVLEQVRRRYQFVVVGYVVMPEHFHLLITEPQERTPSTVMQALKLGFVRRDLAPTWSRHGYLIRLFFGVVKSQPGDISIVENAGTFLLWYDTCQKSH